MATFQTTPTAFHSSPTSPSPFTPNAYGFRPQTSSPLVQHDSSPYQSHRSSSPLPDYGSSPTREVQARRRSGYKSLVSSASKSSGSATKSSGGKIHTKRTLPTEPDQTSSFLKKRFRSRCFERLEKARERAVQDKRFAHHSSDADYDMDGADIEMDDEDEDPDDAVLNDDVRAILHLFCVACLTCPSSSLGSCNIQPIKKSTTIAFLMNNNLAMNMTSSWKKTLSMIWVRVYTFSLPLKTP